MTKCTFVCGYPCHLWSVYNSILIFQLLYLSLLNIIVSFNDYRWQTHTHTHIHTYTHIHTHIYIYIYIHTYIYIYIYIYIQDNPYFYYILHRNIFRQTYHKKDLCRFLQPCVISSTTFDEKVGFPTGNHKKICEPIIDLISNDWKHFLRTETSQKSLLKTFYYNNKDTRKLKNFLIVLNTTKLSNSFHD